MDEVGQTEDRISDLPADLIDKILLLLPIRDAARTSALARNWRYKWKSIPELVFSGNTAPHPLRNGRSMVDIIGHVLRSHVGPILKFKICHEEVRDSRAVNSWIRHLLRMHLKEFSFCNFHRSARYISNRLFAFHDLVHLQLTGCAIRLPARFQGLKKLESLELIHVASTQDDIQRLISSSPRLTKLSLQHLDDQIIYINLDAPDLQVVEIISSLEDLKFLTPNRLVSVTVSLYRDGRHVTTPGDAEFGDLSRFLLNLPLVHTLNLHLFTLEYFLYSDIPEKLPTPCTALKYLTLQMDFGNPQEILAAMCILRSAPNLEDVELTASLCARSWDAVDRAGSFWDEHHSPGTFERLKLLSFRSIKGWESEKGLVKFLLSSSPALQKIIVRVSFFEDVRKSFLRKLIELPRASPQVQFVYEHKFFHFEAQLGNGGTTRSNPQVPGLNVGING